MFDLDFHPLPVIDSATQYPKIHTYHPMVKGRLVEEPTVFPEGPVVLTEKLDGTNCRIVVDSTGGFIIGSRNQLLYAAGDRILNPELGIVEALIPIAARIPAPATGVRVYFGELYGGKITAASREYTGHQKVGFRLFDVATIPDEVFGWDPVDIARWRDQGGQQFAPETELTELAKAAEVDLTPRLGVVDEFDLPTTIAGMHEFLVDHASTTCAVLDQDGKGHPEGIVARTLDRSQVVKIRHKDYQKAAKNKGGSR